MDREVEILWMGRPSKLIQRIKSLFHLNFTKYIITKDEIIICNFLKKKKYSLYEIKDLKFSSSKYQNSIGVGNISFKTKDDLLIKLLNIKKPLEVKKILRDAIEDDIMERTLTYIDVKG